MLARANLVVFALLVFARGLQAEPRTVERAIEVAGATRTYLIHVPPTWDRVRPLPVLFVFHGAGSDSESMVRAAGFDALADELPMLVVYPRARAGTRRYEVDPPPGRASGEVLFVDALLERLRARFPLDPRRIWATGFSNGAALCYRLAAERPHVFAAIAPVAGYLPQLSRAEPVVPVPLLHVHGTADVRVGAPKLDAPSAVGTWARWNGATEGPSDGPAFAQPGLALRRLSFAGKSMRSDTQLLLVEGQGHVWAGGPGGAISRAILEFLRAHPLEEPANPLVGKPLGSLAGLRWLTPDGRPLAISSQPLTLFFWWTHPCPECRVAVPQLAGLAERYRARGLRMAAVVRGKGTRLSDAEARAHLVPVGFSGPVAVDEDAGKYLDLRARSALREATSLAVLVAASGVVQWLHAGTDIAPGTPAVTVLDALLDRVLPAAVPPGTAPRR